MIFLRRLVLDDGLVGDLQKGDLFNALLCDDVLIDILTRLPLNQILQCRGVCRRWRCLIREPRFAQFHLRRSRAVPIPFFQRGRRINKKDEGLGLFFIDWEAAQNQFFWSNNKIRSVPIKNHLLRMERHTMLRCCCNGLLIFGETRPPYTHFICNPTTREVMALGSVPWIFGFYFHLPTNSYRLLCVDQITEGRFRYYVRGLDLVELKEVGEFNHNPRYNSMSCLTVDGFIYAKIPTAPCSSLILKYDLNTEELKFMPHPPLSPQHDIHYNMHLIEMGTQLGLGIIVNKGIDIWVLEDNTNWIWTKKYNNVNLVRKSLLESLLESLYEAVEGPRIQLDEHREIHCLSVRNQELILWYPEKGILKYHLLSDKVEQLASPKVWSHIAVDGFVTNGQKSLISLRHLLSFTNSK